MRPKRDENSSCLILWPELAAAICFGYIFPTEVSLKTVVCVRNQMMFSKFSEKNRKSGFYSRETTILIDAKSKKKAYNYLMLFCFLNKIGWEPQRHKICSHFERDFFSSGQ